MHFPLTTWRLIQTPPARGAWNMAVDEAILYTSGRGESPPTLRLYAWEPACLSLGYAQPVTDVDQPALAAQGWELVRRPTGGRAILHVDELTYSVTGPQDEPRLAGSVLESYRILSEALLQALIRLGVNAQASPKSVPAPAQPNGGQANPVCFEVPSNYEITIDGKKLIGSAQARRKEGVLQHGSLPLFGDLRRITTVLAFPDENARQQAAERLAKRATTLEQALGAISTWEQAAQAFTTAFQETLNLELQTGEITAKELQHASLLLEKYTDPVWNNKQELKGPG
jgi:lipoyl(octanoyl) transferase